jgi:hypothetical protein
MPPPAPEESGTGAARGQTEGGLGVPATRPGGQIGPAGLIDGHRFRAQPGPNRTLVQSGGPDVGYRKRPRRPLATDGGDFTGPTWIGG